METIQQFMESIGLDEVPPDVLSVIGLLLVVFVLWRLAMIKVKALIGIAVVIVLALAAWRGYLWMHS
jgi:hypothetical protein